MIITPVDPASPEAAALILELDLDIAARYPGSPINGIDAANFEKAGGYFVVARDGNQALGCGAFRPVVGDVCAEVKRMFVSPAARRRGVARVILRHLEAEIRRRGFQSIVIETGNLQTEAIALYESEDYFPIPAFLNYAASPISRCFAKRA